MPGTSADDLPSIGFLARYLADAAKQRMPARSVVNVLQTYVDRGLPADLLAQAFELARGGLAEGLRSLLTEYADGVGEAANP
jgi:hypothetical protein